MSSSTPMNPRSRAASVASNPIPMFVGEVRWAMRGSGTSWKLSGGRPLSSGPAKVEKKRQVLRATPSRYSRSSGLSSISGGATGRLSQKARRGASSQRSRMGAATGSAAGRRLATRATAASAPHELAAIWRQNRHASAPLPAGDVLAPPTARSSRAALAAEVSHSRSLRRVKPRRKSVTTMACAICQAW